MIMRNAWIACTALLVIPSLLFAQNNRERKNVQARGALKAVAGSAIQVVSEDGEQWVVQVDPRSKYNVFQGSAELRFLRPGMLVEFRNSFDKKGKPQSEVRELKVFTPREDSRIGLTPVSTGLGAGNLFSDSNEDAKKKQSSQPVVRPFIVAGPIRSLKGNKLAVAVGAALVRVQLADKVRIAFDLADFSLVRAGDTVEVSGWAYADQPSLVMASRLTITAAKPLGSEAENPKKKPVTAPDLNSLDDF